MALYVTTEDVASTSVCTDTLTSATGTLSCTIPNTIGNTTVRATIYRNGVYQAYGNVNLGQGLFTGYKSGIVVFLSVIVFLSLLGLGVSNNPMITAFFIALGVICLVLFNLVESAGFLGVGATVLFILIAIVVLLIKGARRS